MTSIDPTPGHRPAAVVFDLGGVLIDWNPRHLYRKLFPGDEAGMETFLATVCTPAWNAHLDAGASWPEAIDALIRRFPGERDRILAYDERWPEMLGGAIDGTVAILAELHDLGIPVYALSNWSSVKYAVTRPEYPFLDWFRDVVISGEVGINKPDPRVFRLLLDRHGLDPRATVYVDDLPANIDVAAGLGMKALLFTGPERLGADLTAMGLLDAEPADAGTVDVEPADVEPADVAPGG